MYYRIANPKIIQACNLMKEALAEQIQEKGRIISILTNTPKKSPESKSVKQRG